MNVELIYDAQCLNVEAARSRLREAFQAAGLSAHWREWDRNDPESPARVRGYGSPTILIDGQDVAGAAPGEANACRVYAQGDGGFARVPSVAVIVEAIGNALTVKGLRKWRGSFAALFTAGVALLPAVACPACWPAYAALLSALGLGFIDYTPYLPLVMGLLMAIALGVLGSQAWKTRRWGPFGLALVGAALVIAGKFVLESASILYLGVGLLVAASLWNLWPGKDKKDVRACPACEGNL